MAQLQDNIWIDNPPAELAPTRAQYMNKQVTFEDYYRAVAKDSGVSFRNAPEEFLRRVQKCLAERDEHLNKIRLSTWDMYALGAKSSTSPAFKRHGDFWSLAGGVCVAKQAARDAVKEREANGTLPRLGEVEA